MLQCRRAVAELGAVGAEVPVALLPAHRRRVERLDIVRRVSETFKMPTFAYQVSGEYAMIKADFTIVV